MSRRGHVFVCLLVCVVYNAWFEIYWPVDLKWSTLGVEVPFRIALGLCIWPILWLQTSLRGHVIACLLVCVVYNAWYELSWRLNPSLFMLYFELPLRVVLGLCVWPILYRTCLAVYGVGLCLLAIGKYHVYGLRHEQ
jgi:hypothetical protein